MTSLTHNRPDVGFGPTYNGKLTTSFEDIALVPLPSFLFILLVAIVTPCLTLARKRSTKSQTKTKEKPSHILKPTKLDYAIIFFALAGFALTVDEMVRLQHLQWGIGLLPVTSAGIVLSLLYRQLGRGVIGSRIIGFQVAFYWIFHCVVELVKISTLVRLKKEFPRTDSVYPIKNQILDVGIVVGGVAVALVFALLQACFF